MTLDGVSRETRERLEIYVAELTRWQRTLNLVSPRSLPDVWTRHVADSLQLLGCVDPREHVWLDLGSGGGLPGLVVAAARPAEFVMLVESDARKCAFLRMTAAKMDANVEVLEGRAEDVVHRLPREPDVVMARALAPLVTLLGYAEAPLSRGAVGLFPKGRAVQDELTAAGECWTFDIDLIRSRTDPEGRICRVRGLRPRHKGSRPSG